MIKVGFVINFGHQNWLGGFNVITNLIKALYLLPERKIEPVLIINKKFKINKINDLESIKYIKSDLFFNQSLPYRFYNKFLIKFLGKSIIYDKFFNSYKIKVSSHTLLPLGKHSSIKSLPWIPDFQYIHYPKLVSLKYRIMKNLNVKLCTQHSTKIILSSFDAKKDIKNLSLEAFRKSEVNSFVFDVPTKKNFFSITRLKKKYKIQSKYFYLPNHYWIHKNHFLVLKSLNQILKNQKNKSILIISTGYTGDHRNLNYFNEIKDYIKKNGLSNNYKYLGVVAYEDVMSLMFHSIAIINPSKFEGWSSSVEQAKSMGKKIILSNINVHREQNPKRGIYFDPNNYNKLTSIMINVWKNYNKRVENKFNKIAYKNLKPRLLKYARNYQEIILKAVQ